MPYLYIHLSGYHEGPCQIPPTSVYQAAQGLGRIEGRQTEAVSYFAKSPLKYETKRRADSMHSSQHCFPIGKCQHSCYCFILIDWQGQVPFCNESRGESFFCQKKSYILRKIKVWVFHLIDVSFLFVCSALWPVLKFLCACQIVRTCFSFLFALSFPSSLTTEVSSRLFHCSSPPRLLQLPQQAKEGDAMPQNQTPLVNIFISEKQKHSY